MTIMNTEQTSKNIFMYININIFQIVERQYYIEFFNKHYKRYDIFYMNTEAQKIVPNYISITIFVWRTDSWIVKFHKLNVI